MSLTLDIFSARAGKRVEPGELVEVDIDLVLANDITVPLSIPEFNKIGVKKVFDPRRIVLVNDHFVPNKDILSAEQAAMARRFAREQGLPYFFDVGTMGVEHALLPEQGFISPGMIMVGADSHTCTYGALGAFSTGVGSTDAAVAMATGRMWFRIPPSIQVRFEGKAKPWVGGKDFILYALSRLGVDGARYASLEFAGEAISALSMEGRLTMCNMAVELGAKNGIVAEDDVTRAYLAGRTRRPGVEPRVAWPPRTQTSSSVAVGQSKAKAADDGSYAAVHVYDASKIEPMVARPHLPSNGAAAADLSGTRIDQVVIGSCTNGRLEDLQVAARILTGRKVHPDVRCIIIPATPTIYRQAMEQGLIEAFMEAGAAVSTPTCGPCLGGYMGVLAAGERCVATTNRNFVGRMGHRTSEVYLAGPAVAAASAILGRVATPEEVA